MVLIHAQLNIIFVNRIKLNVWTRYNTTLTSILDVALCDKLIDLRQVGARDFLQLLQNP